MNATATTAKMSINDAVGSSPLPRRESGPSPAGEIFHLHDRQHMKLHEAGGWSVQALTGSIWITQDGDIRDIVLEAGDSVVLDRDGIALISSFGDASFRLQRDSRIAARQRRIRAVTPPFSPISGSALFA